MSSNFFDTNNFFIDQKVNYFKFENSYQIYNDKGENIGAVKQKLSTGEKILHMLINKKMQPFYLEIQNLNNGVEFTVSRGWTFWMSKIIINDAHGALIGSIRQKFAFFRTKFFIFDKSENQIAEMRGDWKAWDFKITDMNDIQLGSINKKWAGVAKEFFTSADKYNVTIEPSFSKKENKIILLAGAVAIDMVLKESK